VKRSITLEYDERSFEDLSSTQQDLLRAARKASDGAYAPYSRFFVGAAIRLASGAIVSGSNKENASFPAGTCAERNALNYASDHHPEDPIKGMAISAHTDRFDIREMLSPCGICRQVMTETEQVQGQGFEVILDGPDDRVWIFDQAAHLLPFHFYLKELKK
jgi:cytidine deaminase